MSAPIDSASVSIVPDFSRFAAEADRGIESALRDLVTEVRTALDRVASAAGAAGADLGREFQSGGERAEGALRELSRTATTAMNNVERQTDQAAAGISGKLGGALGFARTALAGAALGAGAGLVALTGFGLQAAAALEQTQVAFNSLLGSAIEGQKVFDGLKAFSAATPFELPELADAAKRFLAFNDAVKITDAQLLPFLTTLGNIASVTGGGAQSLSSVTLALGQIASSGRLSLEELNQVSEALPGFSGVAAIAAARGTTTAQAMKDISSGAVSAQEGVAALLKGMDKFPGAAGAMEAQSQTLLGVFSTFKDTVGQALAGAFAPAIPAIKDSLTQITPIIGEALGTLAPFLGDLLASVLPVLGALLKALTAALGPLLKALTPVADALAQALIPLFEALAPVLADLAQPLADILIALVPLIAPLGELVVAFVPIIGLVAQLVGWLVSLLANKAVVPVVEALAIVVGFLADAVAEFGKWLATIDWAGVGNAIGGAFATAWHAVVDFFEGIGRWFAGLPDAAGNAFQSMKMAIVAKVDETIGFAKSIPGRVVAAIGNLGGLLVDKGRQIIDGLIEGIKASVGRAVQTVKNAMASIVAGAKAALGISSPSTVFAQEVGRQIPAGIEDGIQATLPSLQRLLNSASLSLPAAAGAGGGGSSGGAGISFGAGSVVVHFTGSVPTEAEAHRTGQAVGAGIAAELERRDIATAVRTV